MSRRNHHVTPKLIFINCVPISKKCLDSDVAESGSFSCSCHLSQYPNPGLTVQGVGLVGLPLTNASTLVGVSHRAPFGKGEQTIVDEAVRSTWEINAGAVSFANPEWQNWVQNTVTLAVTL